MQESLTELINLGGFLGMLAYLAYNVFLKSSPTDKQTPLWADELTHHFNHETTSLLTEIRDEVKKTNLTLDYWQRYGAPQMKP